MMSVNTIAEIVKLHFCCRRTFVQQAAVTSLSSPVAWWRPANYYHRLAAGSHCDISALYWQLGSKPNEVVKWFYICLNDKSFCLVGFLLAGLQQCTKTTESMKKWTLVLVPWMSPEAPSWCNCTAGASSETTISQITGSWDKETKSMTSSVAESRLLLRIHFPYVHLSAPLLTSPHHLTLGQYLSLIQLLLRHGLINLPDLTIFRWDGRRAAALPALPRPTSSLLRCKSTLIIIWTH